MELENLETHLVLEQRLRAVEFEGRYSMQGSSSLKQVRMQGEKEVQTEINMRQMNERERMLEVRESEIEIQKFRARQEMDHKERAVNRKERELEIKERLNEERTAEYLFKQKELNQRLKDAVTWPLNCLESDSLLTEKLREIKLTPEYYRMATHMYEDDR